MKRTLRITALAVAAIALVAMRSPAADEVISNDEGDIDIESESSSEQKHTYENPRT